MSVWRGPRFRWVLAHGFPCGCVVSFVSQCAIFRHSPESRVLNVRAVLSVGAQLISRQEVLLCGVPIASFASNVRISSLVLLFKIL